MCGMTREVDAEAAVAAGAAAIGFIFWPKSPRYVEPGRAAAIVRILPPFVTPVGVFVNESVEHMNAVADTVGLGAVQLHGDEGPALLNGINRPVVKAVSGVEAESAVGWPERVILLVDAHDSERRGGTGTQADWEAATVLAASRRILLAGGITPANVVEAVTRVRPFGIDVSSGVEDAPGIKNAGRIRELFQALRDSSAKLNM